MGSEALKMLSAPDATNYSATEALRNGQRIDIRALRPDDRDDFIAAVSRTSSQSLYRRFFLCDVTLPRQKRRFI